MLSMFGSNSKVAMQPDVRYFGAAAWRTTGKDPLNQERISTSPINWMETAIRSTSAMRSRCARFYMFI